MPKMIGNWIEGATEIGHNAMEQGAARVRLTYVQACRLPSEHVMASLDTTDRGRRRSIAKRWYRWFAAAEAIESCPASTPNMRMRARRARIATLPADLRMVARDAEIEGRVADVQAIVAQAAQ